MARRKWKQCKTKTSQLTNLKVIMKLLNSLPHGDEENIESWVENWWYQGIFSSSLWVLVILRIWPRTATKPEDAIKCHLFYSNNADFFPPRVQQRLWLCYICCWAHIKEFRVILVGLGVNVSLFLFLYTLTDCCCYYYFLLHRSAVFLKLYTQRELES